MKINPKIPLPRLLILITGISLILGLMLWLVNSMYRLYIQIAFTAPFLANILLFLLIILLGLLVFAFFYYFNLGTTSKNRARQSYQSSSPRLPDRKTEAAEETLKNIRQQVEQIQDKVTQQALLDRSREIEAALARGDIRLAVFGTGSAGKTSLINSIIGRVVGQVGAAMGTTQEGITYRLKLRGVERNILITDMPGILEMGKGGWEREKLAQSLATQADLLLFVVDNDLRQSEYESLQLLAEIGKKSLLIFNKIDLYTAEDQEVILAQLRSQVYPLIPPEDVIPVTANPQPVPLETGELIAPEPEIMPLIKRLAAVLRSEGEDLMADNILLQSQRLGEEAQRLLEKQRQREAEKIIDRFQWLGAGAIALTPLPVLDLLATAAVNAQMVVEIGKVYDCELNLDRGKELALSLGKTLVSLGVVQGATRLLSTALQFNIATYLVGKVIQGVTAAYLTRIAGKSFIEYFRRQQDWGEGGIAAVVKQQFAIVQKEEFVKGFVREAMTKVIQPLRDTLEMEARIEPKAGELEPLDRHSWGSWDAPPKSSDDW